MPFGILNLLTGAVLILFGLSRETSDFWVDCLEIWWERTKASCPGLKRLVIYLDNGPPCASNRRQFIKRLWEFAERTRLEIHLVYYPPYHSKYNPIERVWGILEQHWNGTLLSDLDVALAWASTMTWKGQPPDVLHVDRTYEKGITLTNKEWKLYERRLERSATLPKWDVTLKPTPN